MVKRDPEVFFALVAKRSVEIIGAENLRRNIIAARRLRVKLGVDPTTPRLHLGHVVPLRMLKAFQDAGHKAVLIFGDFTAQIGDPSGRAQARRQLTAKEIKTNERTYLHQVSAILDLRRTEVRHNSAWLKNLKLGAFLDLLTNFTLKSVWEREDFQKRLKAGREVRLHEAMYQVLQAYDSVAVRADVELGSLDQKLNILAGRELQRKLGFPGQDIVLTPYLLGPDGKQKMSKSVGNTVNIHDSADDMFGKVMSVPDDLILNYAELAAWFEPEHLAQIKTSLAAGRNPRDVKLDVAEGVVRLYRGVAPARRARQHFSQVFSKKEKPATIPAVKLAPKTYRPLELILRLKAAGSRSVARRLVRGGALEVDGHRVLRDDESVAVRKGSVIRVGKKKFFRVV